MLFIVSFHSRTVAVGRAGNIHGEVVAVDALCVGLLMAVTLHSVVPTRLSVRLALPALGHIHIANIPNTTAPIVPNANSTKSRKSVHSSHSFDLYSLSSFAILANGTAQNKANTTIIKDVKHAFTIILTSFSAPPQPLRQPARHTRRLLSGRHTYLRLSVLSLWRGWRRRLANSRLKGQSPRGF